MDFRTELAVAEKNLLSLGTHLLTVGSCFSDSIGQRLHEFKFQVSVNPLGTVYHPLAIHKAVMMLLEGRPSESGYEKREGSWFHYDFHSSFFAQSKEALAINLEQALGTVRSQLAGDTVLCITYGTSLAYQRNDNQEYVANCHKMPGGYFSKVLLSQKQVLASFADVYARFKARCPKGKIILSVSPVRHVKDTLELNSVSKSVLLLACHTLKAQFPDVHYFPAYEILMDDLRDYRFYKPDMLHPSEQAIEYIWSKFRQAFLTPEAQSFVAQWATALQALHHRPFDAGSPTHRSFLTALESKLEKFSTLVDVRAELAHVRAQLRVA